MRKALDVNQLIYELTMYNKVKNIKTKKKPIKQKSLKGKYKHELYFSYATLSFQMRKSIFDKASKLNLKKTDYFLDAGCGDGEVAAMLADSVKSMVCIDINDKSLSNARNKKQLSNTKIIKSDILSIKLDDSIFDKVLCSYVFPMLRSFQDVEKALDELIRVTDHKGFILIQAATHLHLNKTVEEYESFYRKLLRKKYGISNFWFLCDASQNNKQNKHDLLLQVEKWPKEHKVF